LLGQCTLNNTRSKLPDVEKQKFFISKGTAHSKTPKQQATTYKALLRPRIKRRSDDDLLVINHLCSELFTAEEPELIVEEERQEPQDEQLRNE
jgi:hypothetical protein